MSDLALVVRGERQGASGPMAGGLRFASGLLAVCERLTSTQPISRPRLVAGTLLSAGAVVAGSVLQRRRSRAS